MPIMEFLVFIFHNVNRAQFAQIGKSLFRYTCIVISEVCSICSRLILNQGKQGRNQGKSFKKSL